MMQASSRDEKSNHKEHSVFLSIFCDPFPRHFTHFNKSQEDGKYPEISPSLFFAVETLSKHAATDTTGTNINPEARRE